MSNAHFDPNVEPMSDEEAANVEGMYAGFSGKSKNGKTGGFPFVAVGGLKYQPPEFLVEDLIETDTLGLLFGDPGCGKSFLAIDLALSVATGAKFRDKNVKQGPVFYIAGEGHNGLARRFAAWSGAHQQDITKAPLFVSTKPAQFLDAKSANEVAEAIRELAARHGSPSLIEIDTLARNFGPGDENSTAEMGQFISAIDKLRSEFPGVVTLIVHHTGHAEKQRARGGSSLPAALDFSYRVEKQSKNVKVTATKMKDAPEPAPFSFILETIELESGGESAILKPSETSQVRKPLTDGQHMGRQSYIVAASETACWANGVFKGVHIDQWRNAFYKIHTGDNKDAKRKAFSRVRSDLTTKLGLLSVAHDIYQPEEQSIVLAVRGLKESETSRDNSGTCPRGPGQEAGRTGHTPKGVSQCPGQDSGISDGWTGETPEQSRGRLRR